MQASDEEELTDPAPGRLYRAERTSPPAPGAFQRASRRAPSTPRMGVVGFGLVIFSGLVSYSRPALDADSQTNALVSLVIVALWFTGLTLSAFGLAAAKRDERPSGLCLAGVILGLAPVLIALAAYFLFG